MAKARQPDGTASLAPRAPQGERRPGLRAAARAAAPIAAPLIAKSGGGALTRLKTRWTEIAGAELAALTWPESLGATGTLRLRVASSAALDLQHRTPLVIERINLFFGRAAVTRLALIQAPLPLPPPPRRRASPQIPAPAAAALDRELGDIADGELRAALARLGRAVIAAAEDG